jgi:hypothetical protein
MKGEADGGKIIAGGRYRFRFTMLSNDFPRPAMVV